MKTVEVNFGTYSKNYFYLYDLDEPVVAGDSVVVDSPQSGLTIVEVISVKDLEKPAATKYVVDRVDLTRYNETLAKQERIKELKSMLDKALKKATEIQTYDLIAQLDSSAAPLVEELKALMK